MGQLRRVRPIDRQYRDPLTMIWTATAQAMGLRVERSAEVFASYDGEGTLTLGEPATLDADDCCAQMILHELCHALVSGEGAFGRVDWGLDNLTGAHLDHERACLCVQAALLGRYGLRRALAPTTDHRAFYDALGDDPLQGATENVRTLSEAALARSEGAPFAPYLVAALEATKSVVDASAAFARSTDLLVADGDEPRAARVQAEPAMELGS